MSDDELSESEQDELIDEIAEPIDDLETEFEDQFANAVVEGDAPENECEYCGFVAKTEMGLKTHKGRVHKDSVRAERRKAKQARASEPKAKKTPADIIDGALRTSKAAGKLSVQSRTLLAQMLGVVLVLFTVRAINASRTPPLNENDQAKLELDQAQLEVMFKPLFDALSSSKVVSSGINSIASQRDYVLCGVYWYQYFNTVKELLQEREIKAPIPVHPKPKREKADDGVNGQASSPIVEVPGWQPGNDPYQA